LASTQQILDRHDKYMLLNYPRYPIAIVEGRGCIMRDADDKAYLDMFSGFGAGILGHCHPDLVAAGTRQTDKLWHVGNLLHTEPQTLLAEQIAEKGFGGRSFFCHSGSDANEAAFKMARLYGQGKRHRIISTEHSFHGRGFAAMQATGNQAVRKGYEPHLGGFTHVPYNDLDAARQAVDDQTIAIIVEPIQGEGGVNVPDEGYLKGLRKLCDDRDLLLIFDEVWTGCGRTGKWFGYQHWDVEPDIMTLGKAIGAGLGVGVMCAGPRASEMFSSSHYGGVPHATTLGGNAVAMAVSVRMFEVIERDNLVERAAQRGEMIKTRLLKFADKRGVVSQVRGRGLFIGIELDIEHKDAWFNSGAEVVQRCLDRGLLINATRGNTLRLAPPLIISKEEIDQGLGVLEEVLSGKE
jgi:acetylornithine/N-succinyldiaminopimelate aminotransferase